MADIEKETTRSFFDNINYKVVDDLRVTLKQGSKVSIASACFDEDVNEEVITAVAKRKPYYFIMRDKSLSSDNVADNFEQIFQAYSKETIRRIL